MIDSIQYGSYFKSVCQQTIFIITMLVSLVIKLDAIRMLRIGFSPNQIREVRFL